MRALASAGLVQTDSSVGDLPVEGNHLIVGPPGTGKTVQAIERTRRLVASGLRTQFLVYNNPLRQYVSRVVRDTGIEAETSTFHSWFWIWYQKRIGCPPPSLEDRFSIDWLQAWQALAKFNDLRTFDALIVDEGQDFPREFYVLARAVARNVTVFADDCQRITRTGSTVSEIKGYLGVAGISRLRRNYRNTLPVAEFAQTYFTGPHTELPELPDTSGPKPRILAAYRSSSSSPRSFNGEKAQARFIAEYCLEHSNEDIGIFVPEWNSQAELVTRLQDCGLDSLQSYKSGKQGATSLDFGGTGIIVLPYGTAKGLEFDTVFIPLMDRSLLQSGDSTRMTLYVLASRARRNLYLLFAGDELPPLLRAASPALYDLEHIER